MALLVESGAIYCLLWVCMFALDSSSSLTDNPHLAGVLVNVFRHEGRAYVIFEHRGWAADLARYHTAGSTTGIKYRMVLWRPYRIILY